MAYETKDDFERVICINGVRDKISFEELQRLREFLSYRHIFNSDYTWGYTSALLDLIAFFDGDCLERVCKHNKIPKNFKTVRKLLHFLLYHRHVLKDLAKTFAIGYDSDKKDFICAQTKNVKVKIIED